MKTALKSVPAPDTLILENRKRIVVVDDHPMMREGIVQWLRHELDFDVCCEAENASVALDAVVNLRPDVMVTDLTLPDRSGFDLIRDAHAVQPHLPVLVISMHDETVYAERALRAGASGYLMKHESGNKMIEAVRSVLSGQVYLSEKTSARVLGLLAKNSGGASSTRSGVERLSNREFDVFEHLGLGRSTHEIGFRLNLCAKTIEAHRANIKRKLSIKTTPELISFAAQWASHQTMMPQ
jgi:DNA-binding NarL/FixJ family response regulator